MKDLENLLCPGLHNYVDSMGSDVLALENLKNIAGNSHRYTMKKKQHQTRYRV